MILGGKGYIGKSIYDYFTQSGLDVVSISRDDSDFAKPSFSDFLVETIRSSDILIYCATKSIKNGDTKNIYKNNLLSILNVCAAIQKIKPYKFVYLSSDSVYDAHKIPIDEDSSIEPVDLYALAHITSEMLLKSQINFGLNLLILRLCTVFGMPNVKQTYGPNSFIESALNHQKIVIYGGGEEKRSFLYIKDVVNAIKLIINSNYLGTVNLVNPKIYTYRQVAELVASTFGSNVSIEQAPRTIPIVHKPYKPTQIFRYIYNLGKPINQVVHKTYDTKLLKTLLGSFEFTPIHSALQEFIMQAKYEKK